jgi:hypothetical protein
MTRYLKDLYKSVRLMTAPLRVKPDFLIIGAQKSGTSSLYVLLKEHPQVAMPRIKEIHFFDYDYHRGPNYYRQHFSTIFTKKLSSVLHGKYITGEASPSYIVNPDVPERVFNFKPDMRLIVILRDPVARAISQYKHNIRLEREDRSLGEAFENSGAGMLDRFPLLREDQLKYHYNYLERGLYCAQLVKWLKFFKRDQILILDFNELERNPSAMMEKVYAFLGVRKIPIDRFPQANKSITVKKELTVDMDLISYYRQDVAGLKEKFQVSFGWMEKYINS